MAKSKQNDLVLDGSQVKLRLQAERENHGVFVHVDWLRFTVFLRNHVPTFAPVFDDDLKFVPHFLSSTFRDMPKRLQEEKIATMLAQFSKSDPQHDDFEVLCQALDVAKETCKALGPDFSVCAEIKPGRDFYKHRWPIERQGFECGWVGFGVTNEANENGNQAGTIHVNLFGHAMTFAESGAPARLADMVDMHQGRITRCDLALDFFNGMSRSLPELLEDYKAGIFNVRGKRPASKIAGDWGNDCERSLYVGCRKSGKETNIYEKGDQLFGRESANPWVRVELRYGNQLRVLSSEILRRPSDFFAGASDWHHAQILAAKVEASAESVPCKKALSLQTVAAEVSRNVRWAFNAAAPTIAAAFKYMTNAQFIQLCDWEQKSLPGRLRKFKESDLAGAFQSVMGNFSSVGGSSPSLA